MDISLKLYTTDYGPPGEPRPVVFFLCPGCGFPHSVIVGGAKPPVWGWNKSLEAPTFTPSILCAGETRCHSFVTDGRIQFLSDCDHALGGRTVDLPEFEWGD